MHKKTKLEDFDLEILKKSAQIAYKLGKIDPKDFVLKNPLKLDSVLLKLVVNQSVFNQTLTLKIPEWTLNEGLLAPTKISLEQSSSQITAEYKSQKVSGSVGIDLSGGIGVDAYFFAKKFENYIYNERNSFLKEIVAYNYALLQVNNVVFTNKDAEEFEFPPKVDFIYLDPARRDDAMRKMVGIKDCQPNLLEMKDELLQKAAVIMVKYSPMLDIKNTLTLLKNVNEVLVLGEKNEVKELVFILKEKENYFPTISCANLSSNQEEFVFNYEEENRINLNFKETQKYLYEPNACIMKAGAFKSIAKKYNIDKLAANTHLYSSNLPISNFPGRVFEVEKVLDFDKKQIKNQLETNKANVSTRNFPYSPDEIKKQMGLIDGGDKYLFFTENHNKKKIVLLCTKFQKTPI